MKIDLDFCEKATDIEKSRKLALQAIKAEWVKDYLTAEFKWSCAAICCRREKVRFCRNRAETCRKLAINKKLSINEGSLIL